MLLPLGPSYGVLERTSSLSSKGTFLARIPPSSLPFQQKKSFEHEPVIECPLQEMGILMWINLEYLDKFPPAWDLGLMFIHWIYSACADYCKVELFQDAFQEAFPARLRSSKCALNFLRSP